MEAGEVDQTATASLQLSPREQDEESSMIMDDERVAADEVENVHIYPINKQSTMNAVLDSKELWKQFDALGTEMIVTRRGRRMFPPIKVTVHDLKPNSFYVLLMDLAPVDRYRYKYQNSKWIRCFEEACSSTRLYIHPESPALGSYWMDHVISFYKLKLTNNQLDKQGHIIVNSMHCYQPRLHIVESNDIHNLNWDNFHTIIFPGTQFTTVTAYQNDKITQLKIENNPFAKGFRHPMSRNRSRPIKLTYPLRSGSETGSDDGLVYNTPIVYPSINDIEGSNNDSYKRISLKRHSSGSDDESSPSLKKVTSKIENVISTAHSITHPVISSKMLSSAPTPMYVVYANGGDYTPPLPTHHTLLPAHHFSSKSVKIPPQNGSIIQGNHVSTASPLPLQIVHINGTVGHVNNGITPLTTNNTTEAQCSSSDSSDCESDSDGSSPKLSSSPKASSPSCTTSIHYMQPPPLISSPSPASVISGLPTSNQPSHHQNIILHQNIGNNQQQFLVPVTMGQLQGKANYLIHPALIGPGSQTSHNGGNIYQIAYPTPTGADSGSHKIVQTLPLIVNGKHGNFSSTTIPTASQTFQVLTIPGTASSAGPQIVNQAR